MPLNGCELCAVLCMCFVCVTRITLFYHLISVYTGKKISNQSEVPAVVLLDSLKQSAHKNNSTVRVHMSYFMCTRWEKECCVSVMCACVLDRAGSRVVSGRALVVV